MTRMLCLGDSITDCGRFFDNYPLGNGYVQLLSDFVETRRTGFSIINCGVDGFTVERLLANAQDSYLPFEPNIITILIGINDIGLMMNTNRTPSQQESMMEEFSRKYDKLLRILSSNGREIILMEPFVFPWPQEYCRWIPLVRIMSNAINELAEKYHLSYLHLHDYLNEEGRRYGLDFITIDGIHLTGQGHEILARALADLLLQRGIV